MSLPVRGAWIEIQIAKSNGAISLGRSPCGERGLKYAVVVHKHMDARRSPCGERGLKLTDLASPALRHTVAPRAGSVD